MNRMVFATAAVFAYLTGNLTPAVADYYEAPWCAVVSTGAGDVHWDCVYRSIEECRPNVLAGNRGFCNPDPYFTPAYGPLETKQRKRRARPQ
jgi:Protein of unknown function (DUF3551)